MHLKSNIILASASPRRSELLRNLELEFQIIPAEVDETYDESMKPEEVPEYLSALKAQKIFNIHLDENPIVIGADTIVISGDEILEKPKSIEEAGIMLKKLSGESHQVITGVSIISRARRESFSESTTVHMYSLSEEEIEYYINNYSVLDKAGGYGIQDWIGHSAIKNINGSYLNVVGLPVSSVYQRLKNFI